MSTLHNDLAQLVAEARNAGQSMIDLAALERLLARHDHWWRVGSQHDR